MKVDLSSISSSAIYHWMVGLITPRPIAWVSTRSADGVDNLAPFSFFNGVGANPPCLMFCPANGPDGGPKDTLANVRSTGVFAVNLVTEQVVEAMNISAGNFRPEEDEFEFASVQKVECDEIPVARVEAAVAAFSCELLQAIQMGTGPGGANLVVGKIVGLHVADSVLRGDRLNPEALSTVGRLGGASYCRTTDRFELPRP